MFLNFKYFLLPGLMILALSVSACEEKKQAATPTGPVEVSVVVIESQNVPLFAELPGRISAFRVAEVRPQVSGIIQKRLFEEGRDVEAGQQLYQIDPATYQAALQSAQAGLAKAKANLKSVEAKANRYAELVKVNAVSHQDYDDTVAALDQAKAQIMASEAEVQTAQINLDYTKVYAPISGRIGKSNVTEGALVTASQAAVLTAVTQLDPIYVDVSQSSSELMQLRQALGSGKVQSGDSGTAPVTLTLDGTAQTYDVAGKLQFSDVTVDQTTGAVQLRAVFPNPHHDLLPGLFVRARIEQGVKEQAILVPQQSLVRTPDGAATVWVVGSDNKVSVRPVEVGQAVGDKWIVSKGLQAGDQVVTQGLQKIRPGTEVHSTSAAKPTTKPNQP